MLDTHIDDILFRKYLRLLGIKKRPPNLIFLHHIIQAQISRIPFENISKLYFKKRFDQRKLIDFEQYLDGIENHGFGGTCYAINFYLNQLLNWLGYDVKLCGANMSQKDVHLVNIVNLNNHEFLVDTGYAAPFFKPLPLDQATAYWINMGNDKYLMKPGNQRINPKIEVYYNGERIHGYEINPRPRKIAEFKLVIEDSFSENATFMNALLLSRFDRNIFIKVHNMTFSESIGNEEKKQSFHTLESLISIIHERFNMPKSIITESIEGLHLDIK